MAARLQLCSLAILPSHTPCQLLRAYQHKTVLDLIFQIHSVVMRISRCRPWLTCWRCAHSLRHRIARRSARLLDRFKRLLYLRRLQYLRRLLYLRRLKYLQRLLCLRKLLYLHRQAILDLQATSFPTGEHKSKARLCHPGTPKWTVKVNRPNHKSPGPSTKEQDPGPSTKEHNNESKVKLSSTPQRKL